MKKLYIILLLLLATFRVSAQEMPSVAGVTFGWTYEQCKKVLNKKYKPEFFSSLLGPNELRYREITLGGHYFDNAEFMFQSDEKRSYLSQVFLIRKFDLTQEAEALKFMNELYETYFQKYKYQKDFINDYGYIGYLLGENPLDTNRSLIIITTFKNEDSDGNFNLWTGVCYGPIEFVKPEDEI